MSAGEELNHILDFVRYLISRPDTIGTGFDTGSFVTSLGRKQVPIQRKERIDTCSAFIVVFQMCSTLATVNIVVHILLLHNKQVKNKNVTDMA